MKIMIISIIIGVTVSAIMAVVMTHDDETEYTDDEAKKAEQKKRKDKKKRYIAGIILGELAFFMLIYFIADDIGKYILGCAFDSVLDSCCGPEHSGNYGGTLLISLGYAL